MTDGLPQLPTVASNLAFPHASLAKSMKPRGGPSKKGSKRAVEVAAASAAASLSGAAARSSASTTALKASATPRHQRPSDPQWQLIRAFCFDTSLYTEATPSAALSCLRLVDSEGRCLPHLSRAFTLMHPSTKQKRIEADPDNTAYRFIRVYRNRSTEEERVACADLLAAFGGEDNAKQWKNKFPAASLIDPVGGQSRWTLSMSDFVLYVSLVHARVAELQGDDAARLLAWTKEATFAMNLFRRDTEAAEMGRAFVQAVLEVFLTPQMVVRQIQLSGQGFIDEGRAAARAAAKAAATAAGAIAPEPLVASTASLAPTSQLLQQPVQPIQSVESLLLTESLEDEEEDPTDTSSVAEEQDETPPSSQQEQPPQAPSNDALSYPPYPSLPFLPYSFLASPSMLASSPVHSPDAEDCESLADAMELEAEEGEAPSTMMAAAAAAASAHPLSNQFQGFELGFEAEEFYEHQPRASTEQQSLPSLSSPSLFGQMRSLSDSCSSGGQLQRSTSGASTNNSSGIDFLN